MSAADAAARFWGRVRKSPSCWEWTGAVTAHGYGTIRVSFKQWSSHRLSWALHHGDIPLGMWVLHHCDNRLCVNPDHLYIGTATENNRDTISRCRRAMGESAKQAKLTAAQVAEIRLRYESGEDCKSISRDYPVSHQNVWCVCSGKTWRVA